MGNKTSAESSAIELPKSIFIVRHGERADEAGVEHDGHRDDPPLTAAGIEQARKTGIYFTAAKIDRVFASPFTRTMQTAHEICKQLNMKINIEAALSEEFLMDPYNTPVQPFEKLIKMYETANPNYRTHFDKEGMQFGLRVIISNALQSMLEGCSGCETIMLVTHRVLYNYLFDFFAIEERDLMISKVPYCSVTTLTLDPEKAKEPFNRAELKKQTFKEAVFCRKYKIFQLCNASHLDPNDEHNKNHTTVTL